MTRRIGIALLALVVLVVIGYQVFKSRSGGGGAGGFGGGGGVPAGPAVTVKGKLGGEKLGLIQDPEVVKILKERFGLTVDASRQGSIEMVSGSAAGQDFLWPSSQIALEIYRDKGAKFRRAEVVFNSPMV